jgi:PAS domain S-box-containing protein
MKSPQRHRVKELMQTQPQRFQILSDHAPFGMMLIDKDGTFRYFNPKFKELFGYDLSDIPNGKTWFRKAYPDPTYRHHAISAWVDDLKSSKLGGKRPRVFTVICKDGAKKIINFIRVQLETGENLMTCEDITDRKPAEDELLKSEEEAKRLAQENAIMAEIGRIISSTLDIEEIYERFAEEVNKLIPFDRIAINIINPKDQTVTIAYVAGLAIEGRRTGIIIPLSGTMTEEVLRTRSTLLIQTNSRQDLAKRFPLLFPSARANFKSFLSVPLFSKDQVISVLHIRSTKSNAYLEKDLRLAERVGNQIAGAIANAQLYSERKQAEEKYRTILRTTMDGFWMVDMQGRFLEVNDAYCSMIGYSRDELLTMRISDVEGVERPEETARRIQRIMELGGDRFETRHNCKDGRMIDIEVSVNYMEVGGARMFVFLRDITERKQAEETLRESERKFRDLYDNAPLGYHEYDAEGRITNVNRTDLEMLGYTREELIGQPIWKLNVNEEAVREQVVAKLAGTLPPGKELERTYKRKDGTIFPVLIEDRLILDEKGRIKGIRCTIQDITERKRTEEALQTEKQRSQILSENAPFGMVMIDRDGTFRYINPKFKELFGYDLRDIPDGKTWFRKAFPDPTYRHSVISAWINDLKIFPPGERRPRVFTATCKDGTEKIVNLISVQLETGENLVTCEDMTEHIRFEETLRESEERYRTLFEGSRDAVYITTREGKFVDFNQAFLDLLGYGREEVMALQAQDSYVFPSDRYRFQKEIEKNGFVRDYEVRLRKQNGKEMDCLLTASVRRGSDGTILGYQGIIRDITEHKRAEKEMKALEEQFRQSQKMEAIGRLAGGIAHDFNNILTIIQGYCQLSLYELKGDHPLRENIEGIKKSTDRAAGLIRKILAFSRRQVMEMRVLDLNTLLMDLDKLLRRIIGEDIDLVTVLTEDLGRVKVDPGQIEQVILNLAVNAKDAMPNGGKLTIETANAELDDVYARSHVSVAPGQHVMLSVSDTGVGMSPEVKERIFEPFYTTKEKGKGTGLGLSTVYGIVKQSGGNIWVYSELGQGTTFKIYLPRAEAAPEEIMEKVAKEEPPRGSETILVVEDEEELRKLAVQFLQKQGYRVLEATQGEEALLICEQHKEPIHLLVTDVVMPGMSGRELSERLTSLRPEIKILYMSGHTNSAIFHHGVLEPGVILLQKPFTLEGLARKVREVLDK